jgi:hypothetical protein
VAGEEKDVSAVSVVLDMKANLKVVAAVADPRKKTVAAAKNLKFQHHYKEILTFMSWRMACCRQEKNGGALCLVQH